MCRYHRAFFALFLLSIVFCFAQPGNVRQDAGHVIVTPDQAQWQPSGGQLPPGAHLAVLQGDASQSGAQYSIALKMPGDYKIPPHWHPMDANVVVIKGAFVMGLGDKFDRNKGHELTAGTFMKMPKDVRHFEWTKGETIVYIYGVGPLDTIYVNPADDPRKAASK